jgi:hypothetical protein
MSSKPSAAAQSAAKIRHILASVSKDKAKLMARLEAALLSAAVHRELYGDAGLLAEVLTVFKATLPAKQKHMADHAQAWATHVSGHTFFVRDGSVKAGKQTADAHQLQGEQKPFEFTTPELEAGKLVKSEKAKERAEKAKEAKEAHEKEFAELKANARPMADIISAATVDELVHWGLLIEAELMKRQPAPPAEPERLAA